MTCGELAKRAGGHLIAVDADVAFNHFALDSREVRPGWLFLAIKGARVDGHDFVREALESGAVATLVERPVEGPHILVENLVEALARLALSFRLEFMGQVIGVTGSAGKTTTKEFIAAALTPLGQVAKTLGNRNTEFTAPLVWAELQGNEKAVVVEMSMRGFGQIAHLAEFTKPEIGVITNIGLNHVEKVGNSEGVARAKAELFEVLPPDGLAIMRASEPFDAVLRFAARCPVETFGWIPEAGAAITNYRPLDWTSSEVTVRIGDQDVSVRVPGAGRHFAENAAAALLVARRCGVPLNEAAIGLEKAVIPDMRMQARHVRGATFVMDNYNAAPQSFIAALQTLAEVPCEGRRIVVAGDMRELGDETQSGHGAVGRAIVGAGVDLAIFYGDSMQYAQAAARELGLEEDKMMRAETLDELVELLKLVRPNDTVLIKGSRALELERAVQTIFDEETAPSC